MIYIIDKHKTLGTEFIANSDEYFVKEAKRQGMAFTPEQFHEFFNNNDEDISCRRYMIKVIDKISYTLKITRMNNSLPPKSVFTISLHDNEDKMELFHKKYSFLYTKIFLDEYRIITTTNEGNKFIGHISVNRSTLLNHHGAKLIHPRLKQDSIMEMNLLIQNLNHRNNGDVYRYELRASNGMMVDFGTDFYGVNHHTNGLVDGLPRRVSKNVVDCIGEFNERIWIQ